MRQKWKEIVEENEGLMKASVLKQQRHSPHGLFDQRVIGRDEKEDLGPNP